MASKNDVLRQRMVDTVYGSQNTTIISQPPAPLSDFVAVEYALPGCPIEKHEFIQSLASLLHGDAPVLPTYPICVECKAKENICLLVRQGLFCMGPLTVAGCGARCPSHSRPCAGCRGPVKEANIASEAEILKERGFWAPDIARRLVTFAYPAKPMDLLKTPAWLEAAMV